MSDYRDPYDRIDDLEAKNAALRERCEDLRKAFLALVELVRGEWPSSMSLREIAETWTDTDEDGLDALGRVENA